jgi:hypothetical protein
VFPTIEKLFRFKDQRHGVTNVIFTLEDPRKSGYQGNVEEGVTLDYDMEAVHSWSDGSPRPDACLGRAPDDPKHYKVFKYRSELQSAGYEPIPGTPLLLGSWNQYATVQQLPPDPDQTDDEPWYDYLDRLDEDSRHRRQRAQAPAPPMGKSRDEVAAWVARKHLFADSGIREVWYLPRGAPLEEIRLLELNDRLAGTEAKAEAIDFGLDVEGARFRLFVADITTEQLDKIKQDPSRLPPGWSLDENRVWRRGA